MKRERERRPVRPFSPARVIAASFLGVILVGTVLLMLPVSSKNGEMLHPLTALFTATSATCVTGLTLVDPYTQFTFFWSGGAVDDDRNRRHRLTDAHKIFFMFSLRKKLGLRTLRLAQENTNAGSFHNIRSLLQIIVATTLLIESIGGDPAFASICAEVWGAWRMGGHFYFGISLLQRRLRHSWK